MPLKMVDIGPSGSQLLLLRKRLNDVELKGVEEQLVKDLIHFLVGQTHCLQIDLVIVHDLGFCYFLVAFRQDVVWVLEELVVEHPDGLGLARVNARLWGCEELRAYAVFLGVELQVRKELF